MNFKVTVTQDAGIDRALNAKLFYRGMQRFNNDLGTQLANTARHGISNPPKTGRIYSYRGRKHRASAPYQYPANRSGLLRRKTTYEISGLQLEFGTKNVSYAPILQQFKTAQDKRVTGKKILPRPYLTLSHNVVIGRSITRKMISSVQSEVNL